MRVKRGTVSHRKHKKLLRSTKGYRMTKHKLVKVAHEAAFHAGQYAYAGRHKKKSDMRKIWNIRIGQAIRGYGMTYSKFINKLKLAKITLDRKVLSQMINEDKPGFSDVVDKVKQI